MQTITENTTIIKATLPERDPTKKQEVFYNPIMSSNRNISILLLNSISNKDMNIALPLAGSGIRGLRFLKELKKEKINKLFVNDKKENFVEVFNENLKLNEISKKTIKEKICIHYEDANLFLLNQIKHPETKSFCGYFDYIDIDPFGTPNPFISAAISRITRNGVIAITATDTAALTGTYLKVTKRKYWAVSLKNYMMHETGLRILIRKIQLQGIQFDKALIPILSYHKDHYFRIYFISEKSKEKCDQIIKQHQYLLFCSKCLNHEASNYNSNICQCGEKFQYAGPLWTGDLFNKELISTMAKNNPFPEEQKFLDILKEESKKDMVGFYDLHSIAKNYRSEPRRMDIIMKKLKAVKTHFSPNGIKTDKNIKEIVKLIK
ncbi:MAG: tRNA (guanine(26)-N(2))-dimethyltransferase [Nanoarchaeota archaeon]|nr:tRNA (guanine(26)-N(2))-dimethyltransferase [Nanoarchaeota archaeon]MBU1631885.1 tRNA (guanine(26)-N(2))-dimethyltransferase [Nanoarchaeota archaeon]MBU1875928.1 tRNA (guanine(26)-N(2))-dimethyltransferase [Nanoarchaeota archaeon]